MGSNWYTHPRSEPFFWWGSSIAGKPLPMSTLVSNGTLTPTQAGLLIALFERGSSTMIVSLRAGAGKSTLLDAIVRFAEEGRERCYLRGGYETFDLLETAKPDSSCLLANEISPHLPVYLWGNAVARFLGAQQRGFQIATTAHAPDCASLVHLLTSYPLATPVEIASLPKVVVTLETGRQMGGPPSWAGAISTISPGPASQTTQITTIATRHGVMEPEEVDVAAIHHFLTVACLPSDDFDDRCAHLAATLSGDHVT